MHAANVASCLESRFFKLYNIQKIIKYKSEIAAQVERMLASKVGPE